MTEINKKVAIAHNGCFAGVGTGRLPSQNRGLYTKRDNDMANKIYKNREILNSDKGLEGAGNPHITADCYAAILLGEKWY